MTDRDFVLTDIYDDADATVYQLGEGGSEAVTIFAQRGACVVRPFRWLPETGRSYLIAPKAIEDGVRTLREAPAEWEARVSLGRLILWASRRTPRDEWTPPLDEDDPMFLLARSAHDAQRVGTRVFNRRLIREAAQAFVEDWQVGDETDTVGLTVRTLPNGAVLVMELNQIEAYVMCLGETAEPGDEELPADREEVDDRDIEAMVSFAEGYAKGRSEARRVEPIIVWHPSQGDDN